MSRRNIGGVLDMAAMRELAGLRRYNVSAGRHRPADREGLRAAALELRARGLTSRDISQALGIGLPEALELLGGAP